MHLDGCSKRDISLSIHTTQYLNDPCNSWLLGVTVVEKGFLTCLHISHKISRLKQKFKAYIDYITTVKVSSGILQEPKNTVKPL